MPELPEVQTLRASLEAAIVGKEVVAARVHRRDMVVAPGDPLGGWSRSGETRSPRRLTRSMLLEGAHIERLDRRGKRLAIIASDERAVEIRLGMTGQVLAQPAGTRAARLSHVHVAWKLNTGERFVFRDPRRFGGLWVYHNESALRAAWDLIGPDALDIAGRTLQSRAGASTRTVKAALLDQRVLAGVGNIYADESLFDARIRPQRQTKNIRREEWTRLARAIRKVLTRAVQARGTTLRDYRDARGQAGTAQTTLRVYGRAGLACPSCGAELLGGLIAQRSSSWCPRCQS